MDTFIPADRATWRHVYVGALYALGCSPADVVLDMLVQLTESPNELREAIARMHALPEGKHAYPGFVHTALDYLRGCRASKRLSVRLSELRAGDVLVYNEGTSLPVLRMRVAEITPQGNGSAWVCVVDVGQRDGSTGRGRSLYQADDVLMVERTSVAAKAEPSTSQESSP
jgi:hypothetical protein